MKSTDETANLWPKSSGGEYLATIHTGLPNVECPLFLIPESTGSQQSNWRVLIVSEEEGAIVKMDYILRINDYEIYVNVIYYAILLPISAILFWIILGVSNYFDDSLIYVPYIFAFVIAWGFLKLSANFVRGIFLRKLHSTIDYKIFSTPLPESLSAIVRSETTKHAGRERLVSASGFSVGLVAGQVGGMLAGPLGGKFLELVASKTAEMTAREISTGTVAHGPEEDRPTRS